ncbi:MAG: DNA cytosine methyltransferase [Actinobacteria bacterium]|nr:DNA cytosine methyltransferase [Actinomycetota bacterium]
MTQAAQTEAVKERKRTISAIDLFCGVGGLTHGLEKAGIDVRLGIDINPACEYPYTANNKAEFLLKSVEDLQADELSEAFSEDSVRLLAGCAPCQTFSTYNQKADSSDKRWWLLRHFARLAKELLPEFITMENVPRLEKMSVFDEFVTSLKKLGYEVDHRIVNNANYGVPQHRHRLVLLASKLGPIRLLTFEEFGEEPIDVQKAIGNLSPIGAGQVHDDDPLHQSAALSDTNLRRIKASKPGGTWRDWDEELRAECHKKRTGKTYPSVYGRMSWDEPAPTMTTQFFGFGNGRFGHPEQNRAISLREGAILQSFHEGYEFVKPGEPIHKKVIGELIGNAVPVKLGEVIGKSLVEHLPLVPHA